MGLKGTETEKNILTAFAGESQARNRYAFFARLRRGLLCEVWELLDTASLQAQLRAP